MHQETIGFFHTQAFFRFRSIKLHDWAIVDFLCPQKTIYEPKNDHRTCSNNGEIHCLGSDDPARRPEAEENGSSHVDESERDDQDIANSWKMKGPQSSLASTVLITTISLPQALPIPP